MSEALSEVLQQSLHRILSGEAKAHADSHKLRIALREVCEQARRDSVSIEHLLVGVKTCWRTLPDRERLPRNFADDALARVISACIDEYYRDQKPRASEHRSNFVTRSIDRLSGA